MPIHVAIIRRVQKGKEDEFQNSLRRFLGESFIHGGVHGAAMITSLPGAHARDIGILRSFKDKEEHDAFYASSLFQDWDAYASSVTEGDAHYHELSGLEAWFRTTGVPPPRWKMALLTFLGVFPTSLLISFALSEWAPYLPLLLRVFLMSAIMVGTLTWVVMPLLTKLFKSWITPSPQSKAI